ncbi:MAG: aminotransferase class V-fold PLP-dependent enzyme [Candidatus Tectomicrobia bacterium]|nr:aminotransferase class V-fold PLP-dependent enzyme [Candidatus Tectomicrobia bacterium]
MQCQRHLFSLPSSQHYLNCAYMSPLLNSVQEAGAAALKLKVSPADITGTDFFEPVETLRASFGRLVNTSADRVACIPAASYGIAVAVHNTHLRAGQNVVVPADEFPSNVYGWMAACDRSGAELRLVGRPDGPPSASAWSSRVLEAIDGDTAAVTLTDIHWTDGTPFDVDAIGRRAREVGALFVIDGTQSVGALPFDFDRLQPDLLVCAGYKWLLGPYQYGLIAVGDRLLDGEPFEHNWINRKDSENFSNLSQYRREYGTGARRYDTGERSNFILVAMLNEGLKQILSWDVTAIRDYCVGLSGDLQAALADSPYGMAPAKDRSPHLFGIRVPDAEQLPALLEDLRRREVYVSQRGTSLRVSPHVYNTPEDLGALVEALRAAVP